MIVPRKNWLEWGVFAFGLAALVGVLGYLGVQAWRHDGRPPALSVELAALECVDSGDCKADEICVSGAFYSSDSLASKCLPKKGAYGFDELCGRGTCRLGKTACSTTPPSPTPRRCPTPRCASSS